jgi:hypothetical protein
MYRGDEIEVELHIRDQEIGDWKYLLQKERETTQRLKEIVNDIQLRYDAMLKILAGYQNYKLSPPVIITTPGQWSWTNGEPKTATEAVMQAEPEQWIIEMKYAEWLMWHKPYDAILNKVFPSQSEASRTMQDYLINYAGQVHFALRVRKVSK